MLKPHSIAAIKKNIAAILAAIRPPVLGLRPSTGWTGVDFARTDRVIGRKPNII